LARARVRDMMSFGEIVTGPLFAENHKLCTEFCQLSVDTNCRRTPDQTSSFEQFQAAEHCQCHFLSPGMPRAQGKLNPLPKAYQGRYFNPCKETNLCYLEEALQPTPLLQWWRQKCGGRECRAHHPFSPALNLIETP
jgi:hypothetical protein